MYVNSYMVILERELIFLSYLVAREQERKESIILIKMLINVGY